MSATSIFILGIVAAGILAAAGIFTIALRRGPSAGPVTGSLDRRAVKKDRQRGAAAAAGSVATIVDTAVETAVESDIEAPTPSLLDEADGVAPLVQRQPITAAEFDAISFRPSSVIDGSPSWSSTARVKVWS